MGDAIKEYIEAEKIMRTDPKKGLQAHVDAITKIIEGMDDKEQYSVSQSLTETRGNIVKKQVSE